MKKQPKNSTLPVDDVFDANYQFEERENSEEDKQHLTAQEQIFMNNFREKRRVENLIGYREQFVYRIFPIIRFLEVLQTNQLTLVKPSLWDDPFENFLLSCKVKYKDGKEASLEPLRKRMFGQCWTLEEESDAMWRIYSHDKDGVKVRTTVGQLWDAFYGHTENPELHCFFGKVEYKSGDDIKALFENNGEDMIFDSTAKGQAKSLLFKRLEFKHENEARLIYSAEESTKEKLYKFLINPNELFSEIVLDPRASQDIAKIIEIAIKKHGYSGEIRQSGLYKVEHLIIQRS